MRVQLVQKLRIGGPKVMTILKNMFMYNFLVQNPPHSLESCSVLFGAGPMRPAGGVIKIYIRSINIIICSFGGGNYSALFLMA